MRRVAVFPGSFDPFTVGHESIVHKALANFDEVIIALGVNSTKTSLFALENRKLHIHSLFSKGETVRIQEYSGLTVDFCKEIGATHLVRGLRDARDFDYEKSIAQMNKALSGFETVFYLTDPEHSAISSTIVREIYKNHGDISRFVTNAHLLV